MLRLYLDEDVRHDLLRAVRAQGVDVLSAGEAGRRGYSDPEQLAFATAEGRVIVSRNVRDYAILHRQAIEAGQPHAGIVAITRQRFAAGEYARGLARIAGHFTPEEIANQFVYLGDWL